MVIGHRITGTVGPARTIVCPVAVSTYTRRLNGPLLWLGLAAALAVCAALGPLLVDATLPTLIFSILVIIATLACVTMRVRIVVSDQDVKISVLGFSQIVPLDSITRVAVGPVTGLIEGAGPRFVGNATAYIVSGPTVQIDTRTTSYLASAEHPEDVVADIEGRRMQGHLRDGAQAV